MRRKAGRCARGWMRNRRCRRPKSNGSRWWREKEGTRAAVKVRISDFLYSDLTGLPIALYSDQEVVQKTDAVYTHVLRTYPTVPSPYYESVVGVQGRTCVRPMYINIRRGLA